MAGRVERVPGTGTVATPADAGIVMIGTWLGVSTEAASDLAVGDGATRACSILAPRRWISCCGARSWSIDASEEDAVPPGRAASAANAAVAHPPAINPADASMRSETSERMWEISISPA